MDQFNGGSGDRGLRIQPWEAIFSRFEELGFDHILEDAGVRRKDLHGVVDLPQYGTRDRIIGSGHIREKRKGGAELDVVSDARIRAIIASHQPIGSLISKR